MPPLKGNSAPEKLHSSEIRDWLIQNMMIMIVPHLGIVRHKNTKRFPGWILAVHAVLSIFKKSLLRYPSVE